MSLGFYIDLTRCSGCRVCQVACKDRLGIERAGAVPRRVTSYEAGVYPNARLYNVSVGCNHCENPQCVANCPTGAMFKSKEGVVLHDDGVCIGCETCISSCPYDAPQYMEESDLIIKCDTCKALRDAGELPVCVASCNMRALDFGDMGKLKEKYGSDLVSEIPCLPSVDATTPNLLIKPRDAALQADFFQVIM